MSISKQLLPLSLITSLLLFSACGGGGGSTSPQNLDSTDKVTVPQKISIDIPDALKLDRSTNSADKLLKADSSSIQSYGYEQLKSTISQAEETINSVKKNLTYLNKMMPDIINACQDIPTNETCHIDAGTITLTVEGHNLSMGKIAYTQQEESKKYQHIVLLDLKPTLETMGESVNKELETIKWSNDENHIETFSDAEYAQSAYTMQLRYNKAEDNSSKMVVTDSYSFTDELSNESIKGNFTLKLNDKNDANSTVNVETTGSMKMGENSDTFSSEGTVSKHGGYLISKGTYTDMTFAEKETFDTTGKLLLSSFCHTDSGCDLNNPDSWIKYDEAEGIVDTFDENSTFDNSFPEDIDVDFDPIELTFTNSANFPKYTYCEILPSSYNTKSLKEDEVYIKAIGSFARFDDELFGTLLKSSEKNNINTLPIVCNNSESIEFFLITDEIRPTMGVKE